jgi:hypothetical protein
MTNKRKIFVEVLFFENIILKVDASETPGKTRITIAEGARLVFFFVFLWRQQDLFKNMNFFPLSKQTNKQESNFRRAHQLCCES